MGKIRRQLKARIYYNPNPAWLLACWVMLNVILHQSWSLSSSKYWSLGACHFITCIFRDSGFGRRCHQLGLPLLKKHLQQHSHLVKIRMTLFADTPIAHPSWGLRGCLLAPKESGDIQRGCCSIAQSCPTLCNRMDCSTPGFPVLHHLPEFAQTHVRLSQ